MRYLNRFGLEVGPLARPFHRGLLEVHHLQIERSIYFVSPTVQQIVGQLNAPVHLHMDATFGVVPVAAGGQQLFTIQLLYEHSVFPIVYAVMERKTRASYDELLRTFKDTILDGVEVASVVTDYEVALRQSIQNVFPNARLTGCWFHYCKAVYLRGRQLGLTTAGNTVEVRQGVKVGMALALLPADQFDEGRLEIQRWMLNAAREDEIGGVNNFVEYLRRQWGTVNVSVHGLSVRTNNSVESFHKSFNQLVGRRHPNVWMFVSYLQRMEHSKACDLTRLRRGLQVPQPRRLRWMRLDARIHGAQERLRQDGDIGHFLRHMSHTVEGLEERLRPQADLPAAPPEVAPLPLPAPPQVAVEQPAAPLAAPEVPPFPLAAPPAPADDCQICRIELATHAYIPCGHKVVCGAYAAELQERRMLSCVICRVDSFGIFRIF